MRSHCCGVRIGDVCYRAIGTGTSPRTRSRLVSARHTPQCRASRGRLSLDGDLGSLVSPTCALALGWIWISARRAPRLCRHHFYLLLVAPGAARDFLSVALASSNPPQRVEARSLNELLQASY